MRKLNMCEKNRSGALALKYTHPTTVLKSTQRRLLLFLSIKSKLRDFSFMNQKIITGTVQIEIQLQMQSEFEN